jgi:hypothetical protein
LEAFKLAGRAWPNWPAIVVPWRFSDAGRHPVDRLFHAGIENLHNIIATLPAGIWKSSQLVFNDRPKSERKLEQKKRLYDACRSRN